MTPARANPAALLLRVSRTPSATTFLEVSGPDASALALRDDDVLRVESCSGVADWRVRVAAIEPGVLVLHVHSTRALPAVGKRFLLQRVAQVHVTALHPSAARRSLARSS